MFWSTVYRLQRDIKDGGYEEYECVPILTPEEEKQAVGLLKRAISTSPDKAIIHLATHTIYTHFSQ